MTTTECKFVVAGNLSWLKLILDTDNAEYFAMKFEKKKLS